MLPRSLSPLLALFLAHHALASPTTPGFEVDTSQYTFDFNEFSTSPIIDPSLPRYPVHPETAHSPPTPFKTCPYSVTWGKHWAERIPYSHGHPFALPGGSNSSYLATRRYDWWHKQQDLQNASDVEITKALEDEALVDRCAHGKVAKGARGLLAKFIEPACEAVFPEAGIGYWYSAKSISQSSWCDKDDDGKGLLVELGIFASETTLVDFNVEVTRWAWFTQELCVAALQKAVAECPGNYEQLSYISTQAWGTVVKLEMKVSNDQPQGFIFGIDKSRFDWIRKGSRENY